MPICIECSYPISQLYSTYSKADDRSLGKGVRLTQCPRCKKFADKYVEHDFVVLFIDLVLIKPQVYRHLLFNRLGRDDDNLEPSIVRLGILLLLFDVYLTWARVEKSASAPSPLSNAPILVQYFFFLTLNTLATFAHHITVRTLAQWYCMPDYESYASENYSGKGSTETTPPSQQTNGIQTQPQTKPPDPFQPITPSNTTTNPLFPVPSSRSASQHSLHPSISSVSNSSSPTRSTSPSTPTGPTLPPITQPTSKTPSPNPQANSSKHPHHPPLPRRPNANSISTALLVSSCTKLFPILLVIWGNTTSPSTSASTTTIPPPTSPTFSLPSTFTTHARTSVSWAVLLNNIEALCILLDCGYVRAAGIAVAGAMARAGVEGVVMWIAGFEGGGGMRDLKSLVVGWGD